MIFLVSCPGRPKAFCIWPMNRTEGLRTAVPVREKVAERPVFYVIETLKSVVQAVLGL